VSFIYEEQTDFTQQEEEE